MDSTFQWPESGNYFTGLDVYHLLHCLVCTNSFHTAPKISSNYCWRSGTMLTASTSTTVTGTKLSLRGTTLPLLWCPWWEIAPEEEPTSRSCCILVIHAGAMLFHVKKRWGMAGYQGVIFNPIVRSAVYWENFHRNGTGHKRRLSCRFTGQVRGEGRIEYVVVEHRVGKTGSVV